MCPQDFWDHWHRHSDVAKDVIKEEDLSKDDENLLDHYLDWDRSKLFKERVEINKKVDQNAKLEAHGLLRKTAQAFREDRLAWRVNDPPEFDPASMNMKGEKRPDPPSK
jgi:hypothetical protein